MQAIQDYINRLNLRYQTGISREHDYRGDLQNLLETLLPGILVTNESAHIACGAPVMIVMGNSPYSVSSSTKGDWMQVLIKDYKKDLIDNFITSYPEDGNNTISRKINKTDFEINEPDKTS